MSFWCAAFTVKKRNLQHAFFEILGVSTVATVDEGLCPLNPCELLKKLDQNFLSAAVLFSLLEKFLKRERVVQLRIASQISRIASQIS